MAGERHGRGTLCVNRPIFCYCLNYSLHSRLDTGIISWEFQSRDCGGSLHPRTFLFVKVYLLFRPDRSRSMEQTKTKNSTHLQSHQRIHTTIKTFRPTVRSNQKTVYINTATLRNVPYAASSWWDFHPRYWWNFYTSKLSTVSRVHPSQQ